LQRAGETVPAYNCAGCCDWLLTAISLLLVPSGQAVARKPLPTEPLEKFDNPPAVAALVLGISPALVSSWRLPVRGSEP